MKQHPVRLTQFTGINNVLKPEHTAIGELQGATNVYINDKGKVCRRDGYQRVYSGDVHSIFNANGNIVFREGTALKILADDYSATTIRDDFVGSRPVRYLEYAGKTFYTDGIVTGIIEDSSSRTWGLDTPSAPVLTETIGDLPSGRYQVACTFLRNDGQESGAKEVFVIDITSGGIIISNIPVSTDPTVTDVVVYASERNGAILYKAAIVQNGITSITVRGSFSTSSPLMTANMEAPPSGQLLAFYDGRIYIAKDNILYYTEAYKPELMTADHNFIPMQSRITFIGGVKDGLWIGTAKETVFIAGSPPDVDKADYANKANYGAIEGTQIEINGEDIGGEQPIDGTLWMFTAPEGIHIATSGGFLKNVTEGRVEFPTAQLGTATVRSVEDATLYIVGLYSSGIGNLDLALFSINSNGVPGLTMEPGGVSGSAAAIDPTVSIT